MSMSRVVLCTSMLLMLAGCASTEFLTSSSPFKKASTPENVIVEPDPDEVRAAEIRKQSQEIEALREALEADRARADAAVARSNAAALQAQSELRNLQSQLAEVRVRADAASAQSDKAFAIATEFLSNLVAAREEQRAIVERNISVFDRMDVRLGAIEKRIMETRQMSQAELAATRTRSTGLEQRLKDANQELLDLREQLLLLHRSNEETRAAIDSGPMLDMLRQLEGTQRDTSGMRGALEELQQEQEAVRKRMQNYYLDLDARIQAIQEKERATREAESRLYDGEDVLTPAPAQELSDDSGSMPATAMQSSQGRDSVATQPLTNGAQEQVYQIEVLPLLTEEILPGLPIVAEGMAPATGASLTPDQVTPEGAVSNDSAPNESKLQADPELEGTEAIYESARAESAGPADALPDIVDTVDILPGAPVSTDGGVKDGELDVVTSPGHDPDAPSLSDETGAGQGDTVQKRPEVERMQEITMQEIGEAPDVQALPVGSVPASFTPGPVEGHAVIVTDWTLDAEAQAAPESP